MARRPGRFDVRWDCPNGAWDNDAKASFVRALSRRPHTGIYRLRFANDQAYIGQAVDVVQRLAQHALKWPDIVGVDFRVENRDVLNSAEVATIRRFEKPLHLRNRKLAAHAAGEAELDLLVSIDEQDAWLRGAASVHTASQVRETPSDADPGFVRLRSRSDFDEILTTTRMYVTSAILEPARTVGRFWTVLAPYRKIKGELARELARVHVHQLHGLTIVEEEKAGRTRLRYNVVVAETRTESWKQRWRWAVTSYRARGLNGENNGLGYFQDLQFDDPARFRAFLADPLFRETARELTWARMRRGAAGGRHSPHFAAAILADAPEHSPNAGS